MNIHILGAHNCTSKDSKCVSLLIDEVLAIDAGGLASSLSFSAQRKLKALLITHHHYDHMGDIPAVAMTLALQQAAINVYSTRTVYDNLSAHLLNGVLYPKFLEIPADNPTVKFSILEPDKITEIEGYSVSALPVNHPVPTVGYQIAAPDGKTVFYTADTGTGLSGCWKHITPELLIIETTFPDRYERFARETGHLCPGLLEQELTSFQELKGYLPRIVLIHMNPYLEKEIESEIAALNKHLDSSITLAYEGMRIQL